MNVVRLKIWMIWEFCSKNEEIGLPYFVYGVLLRIAVQNKFISNPLIVKVALKFLQELQGLKINRLPCAYALTI